jgi:hypothetical protein
VPFAGFKRLHSRGNEAGVPTATLVVLNGNTFSFQHITAFVKAPVDRAAR